MSTALRRWFLMILLVLTVLAALSRFAFVQNKFFWVDEVASAIRIAGMTSRELSEKIHQHQNQVISAGELSALIWQTPESRLTGLISSLKIEDSQHPPLIPMLQFGWVRFFGPDPASARYMSCLFGVIGIWLLYLLAYELSYSRVTALITAFAFAFSPLQLIYAQQLREYSAWTALIILMCFLFLRAIRKNRRLDWVLYAISIALSLFTYVTSAAVVLAHALSLFTSGRHRRQPYGRSFITSVFLAGLCFSPWVFTVLQEFDVVRRSNEFTSMPVGLSEYVGMLVLNLSRNFLDLGIWSVWDAPSNLVEKTAAMVAAASLGAMGIIGVFQFKPKDRRNFVLFVAAVCFLIWWIPDFVLGGKRALVPRYLMPCWVALYLGLGMFIERSLFQNGRKIMFGLAAIICIFCFGTASFGLFLRSPSWWTTRPPDLAKDLHKIDFSKVDLTIADVDSGWPLISFARALPPSTKILLLKRDQSPPTMSLSRYVFFRMPKTSFKNFEEIAVGSGKHLSILENKTPL